MCRLESFDVKSGMAVIKDVNASLRIDTQHLRNLSLRQGSLYEFIGELSLEPFIQVNKILIPGQVKSSEMGLATKLTLSFVRERAIQNCYILLHSEFLQNEW